MLRLRRLRLGLDRLLLMRHLKRLEATLQLKNGTVTEAIKNRVTETLQN